MWNNLGQRDKTQTASHPIIIATDEQSVTFTINVKALVAFEAEFRFYFSDTTLGGGVNSTNDYIKFQIAISVSRDISNEPNVIAVEVAKNRIEVDFGYVQPFGDEDPTFEKY